MSARETADQIRMLLPFASALVELGSNLDTLANLDAQIADAKKALETAKQEHATARSDAEAALKQAADAKADVDRHHAARLAEIETEHKKSMAAITAASADSAAQTKTLLDNTTLAAADKMAQAQQAADAIIAQAKTDAAAITAEHADLTAKTVTARSDFASAQRLLEDINARLDQHRRL